VRGVKRLLLWALTTPPIHRVWAPFLRGCGTIFMLHRFRDAELGTAGHDPTLLRSALAFLRRERYNLVDLPELFGRLREDARKLRRTVAFTLDDGYLDQATVAGPIFAEFECPATIFVTTGFLDGALWCWWDRIQYVFGQTHRPAIEVRLDSCVLRYARDAAGGYQYAQADFIEHCKRMREEAKLEGIARLASVAEVELPPRPPLQYAAMSWKQARDLERRGISVGPHTVSHPILARTTAEQSQREIVQSWERVRTEAAHPVPIFCYPNGQPTDYGLREIAVLRMLGFSGAVVGTTGYALARECSADADGPFRVRRFGYPDDVRVLTQCVSGLERVNELVRGLT